MVNKTFGETFKLFTNPDLSISFGLGARELGAVLYVYKIILQKRLTK